MNQETIQLTCEKCSTIYYKPKTYQKNVNAGNEGMKYFYRRHLKWCDPCRQKTEGEMLDRVLPEVVKTLGESNLGDD